MGEDDARRSELRQDIDSYISQRKKSKGTLSSVFSQASPTRWISNKPQREQERLSASRHARDLVTSWVRPKQIPRSRPVVPTSWAVAWSQGISTWWQGIKSSVKQTVKYDLSRISSTGGTPMKTDQQEFMDFGEGELTVVPIPEEVEPVHAEPIVLKPSITQSSPLNPLTASPLSQGSALPQSPKQGWFSRWFTKKQAVQQEKLLDEDFLLSTTESQGQPHEANQELRDDFKELAKLCLRNLEQMNKEQLSQYRSTPEFERFKELLRKHNIIK